MKNSDLGMLMIFEVTYGANQLELIKLLLVVVERPSQDQGPGVLVSCGVEADYLENFARFGPLEVK